MFQIKLDKFILLLFLCFTFITSFVRADEFLDALKHTVVQVESQYVFYENLIENLEEEYYCF